MRVLIKIAVVCIVVVAAVYGCVSLLYPNMHVRFLLTVDVKDGDQIRTGSSVVEVEYFINPDFMVSLDGTTTFRRVTGYAVTVDLGEKGLLFLTFNDAHRSPEQQSKRFPCLLSDVACLPFVAYAKPGSLPITTEFSSQKAALDELLRQSGPRDVPFVELPQLVRFLDLNNKGTEKIVSPFDLSASYGPGIQLSRVSLELTSSSITPEPLVWPQWLKIRRQNTVFRGHEK